MINSKEFLIDNRSQKEFMRLFFSIVLIFIFVNGNASERADSVKSKLKFSGNLSLNTNGIASIPAFSLGKPAIIASLTLQKKRFSYDPVVAYGLNLRPWIIDNWFHYRIISRPKFDLRLGADFSMFFSEYDTGDEKILQGQQYLTFEIAGVYKITPKSSYSLMYWSDNGQDPGTMTGNFFNMMYDQSDIRIGKSVLLSVNVQFFYIDYTGNNDGLFLAPKVGSQIENIPVSLFFQATQAIVSNVEPFPGFRWNAGVAYLF
jgi:hypothetical protein